MVKMEIEVQKIPLVIVDIIPIDLVVDGCFSSIRDARMSTINLLLIEANEHHVYSPIGWTTIVHIAHTHCTCRGIQT